MFSDIGDTHVPHEQAHADATDAQLRRTSDQGELVDIAALTGGEAPTEAEFNALVTRVNVLTQVLRDAELIPTAEA
jgi:hypothetical protein